MSDLAADIAWGDKKVQRNIVSTRWHSVIAAARERLRFSRDEGGVWPAELVEVVREQLESGDADDARAVLDAVESWMEAGE